LKSIFAEAKTHGTNDFHSVIDTIISSTKTDVKLQIEIKCV